MYADSSRADVGSKQWKFCCKLLPLQKPEMWMKCLRADKSKHQPTLTDGGDGRITKYQVVRIHGSVHESMECLCHHWFRIWNAISKLTWNNQAYSLPSLFIRVLLRSLKSGISSTWKNLHAFSPIHSQNFLSLRSLGNQYLQLSLAP